MEDLTELLRGVLEGCVLQILAGGGSYGYQIVQALNALGFESVSEGTVYPILVRLETKGLAQVTRERSEAGPPRKVYTLNAQGRAALQAFWERWDFVASRLAIMKEEQHG
ncbi:MAG: PadR family transcriptional regulator [Bifidobacteriaceae bacterium]|jgi:DNA-binding PadR family transcriptional regulator|nr:PadR family transcriptional regulator [Bifidobacteriaceae bacterium]